MCSSIKFTYLEGIFEKNPHPSGNSSETSYISLNVLFCENLLINKNFILL